MLGIAKYERKIPLRTTKTWSISLPPKLVKEAERAAKEENRTKSELIREALSRYLEERRFRKLQAYGAKRAKELGIVSEDDVNQLVREYRNEHRKS
jgi:CopG family transcriptional regulator/antitoxin EndoAI